MERHKGRESITGKKQGKYMMVNGNKGYAMAKVYGPKQMVTVTLEIGKTDKQQATEFTRGLTETDLKESGGFTKNTVEGQTCLRMARST